MIESTDTKETFLDLTYYVDETLRRLPGTLRAPVLSWWPDWASRPTDALRALAASAVVAQRSRASRRRLLQELEHLDDRMLLDIGIQPSSVHGGQRFDLRHSLPVPWR
jgi:uncharacterized protein YjiS (DUF1127 family)